MLNNDLIELNIAQQEKKLCNLLVIIFYILYFLHDRTLHFLASNKNLRDITT